MKATWNGNMRENHVLLDLAVDGELVYTVIQIAMKTGGAR